MVDQRFILTEEDCGFKYRRKSSENDDKKASNNTSDHLILNDKSRRKSAFLLQSNLKSGRISMINYSSNPPSKVPNRRLHEHILPDLPGPIRLKQLIVWSLYLATKNKGSRLDPDLFKAVDELSQDLKNNKISLSWYQRASNFAIPSSSSSIDKKGKILKTHPENERIITLINKNKEYQSILKKEMEFWRHSKQQYSDLELRSIDSNKKLLSNEMICTGNENKIQMIKNWFKSLPFTIDELEWLLNVSGKFESTSKSFCEEVFRQCFDRFFFQDKIRANVQPMLVLRALSNNQQFV